MDKEEKRIRYLEFIENIISRMANCSFRCKEFCILSITGLLAVYASISAHPNFIILFCLFPSLLFWIMDSYYLYKERLYRLLYIKNQVFEKEEKQSLNEFTLKANC